MRGQYRQQLLARSYLRLLRDSLCNRHYPRQEASPPHPTELRQAEGVLAEVRRRFADHPEAQVKHVLRQLTPELAVEWFRRNSWQAYTLLDESGLDNIQRCTWEVLEKNVPGDLIECGVWRGGSCIFMRGLLRAYGDGRRQVWVADSFQGLPQPDPQVSPLDAIAHEFLRVIGGLRCSQEEVIENFRRFDLLDRRVRFLPGWFQETLGSAPIERLALIRLDADYYESTRQALEALYPKLSPGGFVIVDDYGSAGLEARRAVDDFRRQRSIRGNLRGVNQNIAYWEKE
ncbi:MAG: class I SAM-dependent methyltransferase [Candidatus Eremiobacteraeota bacterium]|nr:class I SAM-dependent methyltransferase [Candidatus Eremiobacteraeota bacterium]MCW5868645.1 class I SAM-dependent methyltransferase [Candidatus Eremiobacteraeota bacterium]